MLKSYKKNIAENRNFAYISVIIFIFLRLGAYFHTPMQASYNDGLLWNYLSPFLSNKEVAFILGVLLTIAAGLYVAHINEKYALIRGRTSLPFILSIFAMGCTPNLAYASPAYLGLASILICIDILFSSFQQPQAAREASKIGVILALGSLFAPTLVIYIPIFWIGFFTMRSFSFKVFLSSIFGIAMVYWCVFFVNYAYAPNELNAIVDLLKNFRSVSFLQMDIAETIILAVNVMIMGIAILYNYLNSFKDKTRIRASISFLNFITAFSVLAFTFLTAHSIVSLLTCMSIGSLILAHIFALAEKKWIVYLFIFTIIFYFSSYLYFLAK